jgi:hypothetical protein
MTGDTTASATEALAGRSPPMAAEKLEAFHVNLRIKISALWTLMLFVFIYVDHYSLFRADIRADIEGGKIGGFTISQSFLLVVTAYIAIPALMVFLSLIMPPSVSRVANIVLGVFYAFTIIGGAIGETNYYYILGSVMEVMALAAIVYYAWTWPRQAPST